MVYGCFADDSLWCFRIQGTLNQHAYHSILQWYAIPSDLRLVALSFVFQRDNDPHTSSLCKGYLTNKESDGVLHQMTWPPQSPDLNPIEMAWGELDRRKHVLSICGNAFKTVGKVFQVKLVERMPSLCKAVIKATGGYFEESEIYLDLFNTFLVTTWFHMYFIVLMSSILFYNVENSNIPGPWMSRCVQTFDWYCIYNIDTVCNSHSPMSCWQRVCIRFCSGRSRTPSHEDRLSPLPATFSAIWQNTPTS